MPTVSDRTEERKILDELIVKFDEKNGTELAMHAFLASKILNEQIEKYVPLTYKDNIKIKQIKDEVCFRLEFTLPVLLLFHMATRHSKQMHRYFQHQYEGFTVPSEFVPVYNCNLNHLTLLKTHTAENTRYWSLINSDEESDFICKKFVSDGGRKMIQSSLNFMLQNCSTLENVPCATSDAVETCFRYSYWRPPFSTVKYSPMHDMIYNSSTQVYSYHRIYKTIVRIAEMKDRRDHFKFGRYEIGFSVGKVFMCDHNEHGFYTTEKNAVFAEPDRSRMRNGDLINCIIDMPTFPKPAGPPPLIVAGLVEPPISPTDLKPVIGLVIWKITQRISTLQKLCNVGTKDEVRSAVLSLLRNNLRVFPREWLVDFSNRFQTSLDDMFPLVFEDEENVIYIPPPMMGYILSKSLAILNDRRALVDLSKFVDLTVVTGGKYINPAKLRFSEIGSRIQKGPCGKHWNSLLSDISFITSEIHYSRALARPPDPKYL